jgi:hypothetical protein
LSWCTSNMHITCLEALRRDKCCDVSDQTHPLLEVKREKSEEATNKLVESNSSHGVPRNITSLRPIALPVSLTNGQGKMTLRIDNRTEDSPMRNEEPGVSKVPKLHDAKGSKPDHTFDPVSYCTANLMIGISCPGSSLTRFSMSSPELRGVVIRPCYTPKTQPITYCTPHYQSPPSQSVVSIGSIITIHNIHPSFSLVTLRHIVQFPLLRVPPSLCLLHLPHSSFSNSTPPKFAP